MKEINELVRELRQSRNLSQKFLAQDICSRETLTKFEQRGTQMSSKKLFQILDKMNINVEEFMFLLQNGELPFKQQVYREGILSLHDEKKHNFF